VRLSKTIVQHFKLFTRLLLSCCFLSSCQHAYRNHSYRIVVIVVKLFDQTLLVDVAMLYIKETLFGVQDGEPLMDSTHPDPVTLAALLQHHTGP
jgi:hypothetical protein